MYRIIQNFDKIWELKDIELGQHGMHQLSNNDATNIKK